MSDDEECFEFGNLRHSNYEEGDDYIVKTKENFYGTREELSLIKAIDSENIHALEDYVAEGGSLDHHFNNGGSLLQTAIELGRKKSLKFLLDRGANPNRKGTRLYRMMIEELTPRLYTPIESAAIFNRPKMIKMLIAHGGNPHCINEHGLSALKLAKINGAMKSVRLLKRLPAPPVPLTLPQKQLMSAVLYANEGGLLKILKDRINLDFIQEDGLSPVFMAIENGFYNCLKILLENGASSNIICKRTYPREDVPNSSTARNWTALECAVIHGDEGIIELLISYGANIYYEDIDGRNVFTVAMLYKRFSAAELLKRYAPELMARTVSEEIFKQLQYQSMHPFDQLPATEKPEPSTSAAADSKQYDQNRIQQWVDSQTAYDEPSPSSPNPSKSNHHKDFEVSAEAGSRNKNGSHSGPRNVQQTSGNVSKWGKGRKHKKFGKRKEMKEEKEWK